MKYRPEKKFRVRIKKEGPYFGRVGKIIANDAQKHAIILKLKNKIIYWPATETHYLQKI